MWELLWQWAKRQHPDKGHYWITQRYWHSFDNLTRTFTTFASTLIRVSDTKIRRHVLVQFLRGFWGGQGDYGRGSEPNLGLFSLDIKDEEIGVVLGRWHDCCTGSVVRWSFRILNRHHTFLSAFKKIMKQKIKIYFISP